MTRFLSVQDVLAIHSDQVSAFGGAHGLRDRAGLESAVGQAQQTCAYTSDLYETAAQYCISLAKNHPFVDGNKRVGADCMLTFLVLNDIEPTMTSAQLFDATMRVAVGDLDRSRLAAFLRDHSKPVRNRRR
jgi:death-on-curing protein